MRSLEIRVVEIEYKITKSCNIAFGFHDILDTYFFLYLVRS